MAEPVFSLVTHKRPVQPRRATRTATIEESRLGAAGRRPVVLLVATVLVAWMSEILVGAVEHASQALGMTEVFIGVIVVAIVGNAAEHSTAVLMALKNQMDLAVGIAMGSALQIALFVAPVLVFASYLRAEPMDLLFTPLEVVAVILGGDPRPDGRRGRRVELARRGDAADDLRDPRPGVLLPARTAEPERGDAGTGTVIDHRPLAAGDAVCSRPRCTGGHSRISRNDNCHCRTCRSRLTIVRECLTCSRL